MSGPLDTSQWMYSSGFYPYEIDQSLRFNDDDSAYLSRTPASAGNRKTWTWSGWVKRGNLGTQQVIFSAMNGVGTSNGAAYTNFQFNTSNQLEFIDYLGSDFGGPGVRGRKISTAVFRDPSAYYHIHVVLDTTQGTAGDRMRVWVNGVQITSWGTSVDIPLNADGYVNAAASHALSSLVYGTRFGYFDGYMAEVNFIDGTALDPTSFGEFKSGVWIPKKYTGSYGTNGFYLSFADSAAIGDDLSGNGNDWTPSGLASTDVLLDSPTNNYAVLNNLAFSGHVGQLSDGNLAYKDATGIALWKSRWSTIALPTTGKWYAEFTLSYSGANPISSNAGVGLHDGLASTTYVGFNANTYGYLSDGKKYTNAAAGVSYGASYGSGDIIGIAWDADAGDLTFYKNGVSQGVAYSGVSAENKFFGLSTFWVSPDGTTWWYPNFGQSPFAHTPPAGFLALSTANLPEPTITPARDDVPADYFNTVLWTGNGTADRDITGVGFEPSLSWIKERNGVNNHQLTDAVRGVLKGLHSNSTAAENTFDAVRAFLPDGIRLGISATANSSGQNYVGWNWKANGAGVANTDGTISSTVSANQKAGFSIVDYAGTISGSAPTPLPTVGHGLSAAPKLVIGKSKNNGGVESGNWFVWHESAGTGNWLRLNTTDAAASISGSGGGTMVAPTDSVFSTPFISGSNILGATYIAYCFAEVEGYSKFGSYTGNGSTDGPFVWTSFRPAFVMVKRTDSTGFWAMLDDKRSPANVADEVVYANASNAEATAQATDFLSNGFKLRTTDSDVNAAGTYIFAAFASMPFKFSGGR